MRILESRLKKKSTKFMIPSSRCLLEAIGCLSKFADIGWMILINKTWWLLHVNILGEVSEEKCIVDIKLS